MLRAMPDRCVDHVIADPPYNEAATNARSVYDGRASDSSLGRSALGVNGEGIAWAWTDDTIRAVTQECLRVARRWVIVFCALEQLGTYASAAGACWIRAGAWDRNNTGTPQLTADRPAQGAEGVAIMHAPRPKGGELMRWNGKGARGIWRHSVDRTKGRHPAAKPLPLCNELVLSFTDPGDRILDITCGGGSIGVAAVMLGRTYIGIDNGLRKEDGKPWADVTRERLAALGDV